MQSADDIKSLKMATTTKKEKIIKILTQNDLNRKSITIKIKKLESKTKASKPT